MNFDFFILSYLPCLLYSRIRGVIVWYSVKVEREVGTGGSPARHGFLVYRYFMPAPMLLSRIRGGA